MEEKAVDFDSLSGLIRSTLKRMDRDELSGIFYLMETGKLQQIMLELLGICLLYTSVLPCGRIFGFLAIT